MNFSYIIDISECNNLNVRIVVILFIPQVDINFLV